MDLHPNYLQVEQHLQEFKPDLMFLSETGFNHILFQLKSLQSQDICFSSQKEQSFKSACLWATDLYKG